MPVSNHSALVSLVDRMSYFKVNIAVGIMGMMKATNMNLAEDNDGYVNYINNEVFGISIVANSRKI
jgi:hypothetical protein